MIRSLSVCGTLVNEHLSGEIYKLLMYDRSATTARAEYIEAGRTNSCTEGMRENPGRTGSLAGMRAPRCQSSFPQELRAARNLLGWRATLLL